MSATTIEILTKMSTFELEQEKEQLENKITKMIMLNPDEIEKLDLINNLLEERVK